jgi:argininosuccinate synthase
MKKKVVLAFSGGLDTSYCVKYLSEDKGYEVHTITVNTGGFDAKKLSQLQTGQRVWALHRIIPLMKRRTTTIP